jgi:hypothetical protein
VKEDAMTAKMLSRRAVLRGIGGAAIGLPFLEIMSGTRSARAQATAASPSRYVVMFGGHSLGSDNDPLDNDFAPNTVGPGYDLKSALLPLGTYGVRDDVSVISDLIIPWAGSGDVPPGGRYNAFHCSTASPLFSGMRSLTGDAVCNGPSSDQIVAEAIAGNTTFKSLVFRAQAANYFPVVPPAGRDIMSYQKDPSGGAPIPVPATVSPKAAFDALFSNFSTPGLTPAQAKQMNYALRSRLSVLDLVRQDTEQLVGKLGASDRLRLQRHLDEIRDLERRVSAIPPVIAGSCQKPTDPGADPPVGGDGSDPNMTQRIQFDANSGYSDEQTRARVFIDLITMAFACDLSRVAALMLTQFQCFMNTYRFTGLLKDVHLLVHTQGTLPLSAGVIAWHVDHFARLVSKLKSTPDGSGTLLDSTALVYVCEGGHGTDPTGSSNSSHSSENMCALIAGRVGGLKPGKHVVASGMHPASVLVSAMNAVGVPGGLGEVQADIPALFT